MKKLFVQWQAAREIKSEEKVGVRKASEMPLSLILLSPSFVSPSPRGRFAEKPSALQLIKTL